MSRYPHGGTKGDAIISGSIHWSPVLFLGSKGSASTSPAPSKTTSQKYQYTRIYSAYYPLITPKCHPYVRGVSFTCSEFRACQGAHSFSVSSPGKTSHLQKWFMQAAFWRLIGSAMFSLTFTRYQNSSQGTPQSARSHTDRILCPGHNAAPIGAQGNGDFIGRSQLPRKVVDPTFAHLKNGRGLKLTWFSLQFTIFSNGWWWLMLSAATSIH